MRWVALAGIAALGAACSQSVQPGDAGRAADVRAVDVADAFDGAEVALDVPGEDHPRIWFAPDAGDAASCVPQRVLDTLFAECNQNADCGSTDAGSGCLTFWPGGICTRRCALDCECGTGGVCFQNVCLPACRAAVFDDAGALIAAGGGECCGHGAVCYQIDSNRPARGACFPSCDEPMQPGVPACPLGTFCELYGGACIEPTGGPLGDDNGAPCITDAQGGTSCQGGVCRDEATSPAPNGFIGGYCYSIAIQPEPSAFQAGAPLPRSNCPTGSVVLPSTNIPACEPAPCWQQCTADSDCRMGYECNFTPEGSSARRFATGACLPIDCLDAAHAPLPNHGCPPDRTCITAPGDGGIPRGVCG